MDPDLVLTLGLALLVLSLPALLSAWVDGRMSKAGIAMIAASAGMIGWAIYSQPKGYTLAGIPDVVIGVVARLLN